MERGLLDAFSKNQLELLTDELGEGATADIESLRGPFLIQILVEMHIV